MHKLSPEKKRGGGGENRLKMFTQHGTLQTKAGHRSFMLYMKVCCDKEMKSRYVGL